MVFMVFPKVFEVHGPQRQMREGVPLFGSVSWRSAWSLIWSWSVAPWLSLSPSGVALFPVVVLAPVLTGCARGLSLVCGLFFGAFAKGGL